jgi:hypothetical protein
MKAEFPQLLLFEEESPPNFQHVLLTAQGKANLQYVLFNVYIKK